MEIERFDWFIERIQTGVDFGWLNERSGEKTSSRELSKNQEILRFDVILQHDWPIEQCLLHIRIFFGGKTKRPCFDKTNNEHLPKPFFKVIRKSLYLQIPLCDFFGMWPRILMSTFELSLFFCHFLIIHLLTDTNWIQWVLCTGISNKSICTFTPVRSNGVITNIIGSTSIWRLAFI